MATPIEIGSRLRDIRRQQELTLKQVEIKSRGVWKSVVVGSYERGTRTLSIENSQELARLVGFIIKKRNDWNGHFISMRRSDCETLALMTSLTEESTYKSLEHRRLLIKALKN
ncbi:MAG: hypothetical protein EBZ85_01040 [Actinobacteria bacterium]|nr:hypothetical protein [Actinomycetota bacterium]